MKRENEVRGRKALIAGTIALDMMPEFPPDTQNRETLLAEGRTIYLDGIGFKLGGLVSNTGVAMRKLGAPVLLASKVGNDSFGTLVKQLLAAEDVESDIRVSEDDSTTVTIVTALKGSDRSFWHKRGASQNYVFEDIPQEALRQSDLFHFGYPTGMECMYRDGGENLKDIFRRAKECGVTTSLDLSLPGLNSESGRADWKGILKKSLPYVDVFLPSIEEMLFMFRRESYFELLERAGTRCAMDFIDLNGLHELSDEILAMGPKIFGLKLGKKGFYLRTAGAAEMRQLGALSDTTGEAWQNREIWEPPYAIEEIYSTNGAGDTAIAGFLTGLLKGWTPEACLKLATGAAATRIGAADGVKGVQTCEKIMERVDHNWAKMQMEEMPGGWIWDSQKCAYFSKKDMLKGK